MTIIVICYVAVDGIAFVATFYKSYFSLILSQLFLRLRVSFLSTLPTSEQSPLCSDVFYAYGKKDVIRPLPCSSFPPATRCAGLAVGFPITTLGILFINITQAELGRNSRSRLFSLHGFAHVAAQKYPRGWFLRRTLANALY